MLKLSRIKCYYYALPGDAGTGSELMSRVAFRIPSSHKLLGRRQTRLCPRMTSEILLHRSVELEGTPKHSCTKLNRYCYSNCQNCNHDTNSGMLHGSRDERQQAVSFDMGSCVLATCASLG
eukprot:2006515-Rhodomonas_salina.1